MKNLQHCQSSATNTVTGLIRYTMNFAMAGSLFHLMSSIPGLIKTDSHGRWFTVMKMT
ncbi:Uncharacterised protein [Klebsiella pneumoniae]|nr:Uncharacterised protein [Klebsiella pneumoniae]